MKTDENGEPVFNEKTYLDEDQIKSMFGNISRKRKRSLADPATAGIDSNLTDYEIGEIEDLEAAVLKDSDQIKKDLENSAMESENHPIKISGVDLCQIAERMDLLLNVDKLLSELTKKQNETIFTKLEEYENDHLDEPPIKKKRTQKRKKDLIFQYVKKNCDCIAYNRS